MFDLIFDYLIPLVAICGFWIFLIAPGKSAKAQRRPFVNRTFAHRGLYKEDQSIPENSLPAFQSAVEQGYGIELDVQLTLDGRVVVFHDDALKRMTGAAGAVQDYSFDQLSVMGLGGTRECIPSFSRVLAVINGRVPVIVELKYGPDWQALCKETLSQLKKYGGAYCVESFHPRIVRWFRQNAPEILRGQLSEAYRFSRKSLTVSDAFMMSRLLTNFLTRPQFIAYRIGPMCFSAHLAEALGALRVRWTAHPEDDWGHLAEASDAVIFEHMHPDQHL
jgi:glycerophosphoryl diester phosphodiesterase